MGSGQTTSSITVNPPVNEAYSVIVPGANGCKDSTYTTVLVNVPTMWVCCDTTIEKGTTVKLIAYGNVIAFQVEPRHGIKLPHMPWPEC